jgi:hypothetical protein
MVLQLMNLRMSVWLLDQVTTVMWSKRLTLVAISI